MTIEFAPPATRARAALAFARKALREQSTMGALVPTSRCLSRRMASMVPSAPGACVVELGAGTGAISREIGLRLGCDAVHIAVDRDPVMLAALAHRAPWARRLVGDAADLADLLRDNGIDGAHVVLSSLPWSFFPPPTRARILDQIASVLLPGGTFVTIAYRPTRLMPRARAVRAALDDTFETVIPSATTWANVPPARLYLCRHARRG
ncbi:class I SAM-dependent methyltransferase [Pseudonocardia acaciae]|uniref:class I SAM-dependent methyltransferase n=1 Tax=Pseudonocardia acaciae TaxID=551276 RepID=UPI00055C3521|nr:methyltransferase domain-containing protein [Pseudonocardia acaciae]